MSVDSRKTDSWSLDDICREYKINSYKISDLSEKNLHDDLISDLKENNIKDYLSYIIGGTLIAALVAFYAMAFSSCLVDRRTEAEKKHDEWYDCDECVYLSLNPHRKSKAPANKKKAYQEETDVENDYVYVPLWSYKRKNSYERSILSKKIKKRRKKLVVMKSYDEQIKLEGDYTDSISVEHPHKKYRPLHSEIDNTYVTDNITEDVEESAHLVDKYISGEIKIGRIRKHSDPERLDLFNDAKLELF